MITLLFLLHLTRGEGLNLNVNASQQRERLLREIDTDGDKRITIDDLRLPRAKTVFWLEDQAQKRYEVNGISNLANLLQELTLNQKTNMLKGDRVFENPVLRISRNIRELYWDHLTRQVDVPHLQAVLEDDKIPRSSIRYVYVPARDATALAYFQHAAVVHPEWNAQVVPWDEKLTPQEIKAKPGLLTLALTDKQTGVPYVVPGGRFNEMYGWDSFFEALGLLNDNRPELAKAMVDNFVYEIENYGKILNANRSYYLNRSQPPFLTSMIAAVYDGSVKNAASKAWLARALAAAIKEYRTVWTGADHLTDTGLSRYFGKANGIPIEVEPGHFNAILKPVADRLKISVEELQRRYDAGEIKDPGLDDFFAQDVAVRESGHDTTYRWGVDGQDRATDFVTVDLNSLLYKYELDLARFLKKEFNGRLAGTSAGEWRARAAQRKELMRKFLWDPKSKTFVDYDFRSKQRSKYVSATSFYALWAQDGPATQLLTEDEAKAGVAYLLSELEMAGGVAASSRESVAKYGSPKTARQWDYPNGWAPHQILIWQGLKNYKLNVLADRLIYKWLYTITRAAADYNGTVPEKFDVVKRSHAVFAEYGNVGTQFAYITQEGFGWMNASYQLGLAQLSKQWRAPLGRLIPPEWLEF